MGQFNGIYVENVLDGNFRIFFDAADAGAFSNIVPTKPGWNHVAISFDGVTMSFVLNGVPAGSALGTLSTVSSGVTFGQGTSCCSGPFLGLLDEVRIWNVARSEAEILAAMNVELTGNESGLVGYYKMDDVDHAGADWSSRSNVACGNATIVADSPLIDNVAGSGGAPDANVRGNGISISDGDTTPDAGDGTDFGSVIPNGGTKTNTFTIQNTGTGNLRVTGITASDAQFAVSGITFPAVIGPAGATTFAVTFSPASGGNQGATINIAVANDCDESPYEFAVAGFGANVAPAITPSDPITRQQGSAAGNSIIAMVSDTQTPAGDLTVTATTVPDGIAITDIVNTDGTITANVAASCAALTGANTVVLEVSDGAATSTANLTVDVTANQPPTVAYGDTAVDFNGSIDNTLTTSSDNGTIDSFVVQDVSTFTGTISVDATGLVSFSNAAPSGTHTITIRATDNCGAFTDASFTLTVTRYQHAADH